MKKYLKKQDIYNQFIAQFGDSKYDYLKAIETQGKTTLRCMFVDFIDMLLKNGDITEKQANTITAPKELY